METQTKYPTTGINLAGIGTQTWVNPNRAVASDNSWATVSLGPGQISNYLKMTGYGFNFPVGSTPSTITAYIERRASSGNRLADNRVSLVKNNVVQSENKALSSYYLFGADEVVSYSFSVSGWTAADFNNSNFGVALSTKNATGLSGGITAFIDVIYMTVSCETTQYIVLPKLTMPNLHAPEIRSAGNIYLPKLPLFPTINRIGLTTFIVIPPKLPFLRLHAPTIMQDKVIRLPKLTMFNLNRLRIPTTWTDESTPTSTTWSDT